MAGHNESPRQKMVGMMYLVLTALLALNISKDVLDAFIVVNNGLENTNINFENRNDQLYAEFNLAKSVDPVRVMTNWKKAQDVKLQSDKLVSYIKNLKIKLVAETDDISIETADTLSMKYINSKDNHDVTTNIMIGESEDGSAGISLDLKNKLIAYKDRLKTHILPNDRDNINIDINTDDPVNSQNNENWEMYNFYHRPLVASLTILSKMENDIKNAESTVVDYLLKQADAGNLKFDTVAAKVIPQSNYVLLGEEYKADLFLAAFNKTKNPKISIGKYNASTNSFDGPLDTIDVTNGVGKYTVQTNREGIYEYEGNIKVVSPSGKEISFPFKSEYIVAKPSLTVSADKMNVFYDGLNNPISVSVPGIPNERLKVSISNGSIRSLGNGKYIAKVNSKNGKRATIRVVATMENGETKNMGSSEFRVKDIPQPFARYAMKTEDGGITRGALRANKYLIAFYKNFEFDINPKVVSFTVTVRTRGNMPEFPITGNKFTPQLIEILKRVKLGDRIYFENIKAEHPNGKIVPLSSLNFKVI